MKSACDLAEAISVNLTKTSLDEPFGWLDAKVR
jgi:hypothetical protein